MLVESLLAIPESLIAHKTIQLNGNNQNWNSQAKFNSNYDRFLNMRKFSSYGAPNKNTDYYVPREALITNAIKQLKGQELEDGGHNSMGTTSNWQNLVNARSCLKN
jgi:hypothetical protein